MLRVVEAQNLTLSGILTTHGHWDHSGGNETIRAKCPDVQVKILSNAIDFPVLDTRGRHGTLTHVASSCLSPFPLNMHVRLRTHWICIHIGWIQVASMSTRKVLYFKSYLISACVSGLRKRQGHSSRTDQERGGGRHVSLPSSQARPKAKPHYKSRTTHFLLPLMRLFASKMENPMTQPAHVVMCILCPHPHPPSTLQSPKSLKQ